MALFMTAFYGCGVQTRYKVLSFFFDGVPNPEEKSRQLAADAAKAGQSAKETTQQKGSEHGPYASKQCNECHQRATNTLVLPIEELCFKCHALDMKKKYAHGPAASGGCRVCHVPHSSSYRFLLVSEPEKFCFYCHDEKMITRLEVHQGIDTGCTTCHDPHSSDNQHLLK